MLKFKRFVPLLLIVAFSLAGGAWMVDTAKHATNSAISMMIADAQAQPAANIQATTPLTRNIGVGSPPIVLSVSSQGAGMYASADQSGYNVSRVICLYKQTAGTGSTQQHSFALQNKDAATATYYGVVTSGFATTATAMLPIAMGAGVASSGLQASGFPVAQTWRVVGVVSGTGSPQATFTVGCSVQ